MRLDRSGEELILPFEYPEEHIYFMYGNRVMLENRRATVCYINQNIEDGTIVLQRNHSSAHLPLGALSQIYDIGRIV